MQYRNFGATGLRISEISLGSWLTYGETLDELLARQCIQVAFESGINFFDTADTYGEAEVTLGRVLRDFNRAEYMVGTKCFFPMSESPLNRGLSRKHVVDSVNRSLRRLGLDYIDLLQCHRFDPNTPLEETVRAMDDLIRQGKILYWGVSRWEVDQIAESCQLARQMGCEPPVSNQPPYNMLYRDFEAEILPAAAKLGLANVVYSPLAQGVLSGKYGHHNRPVGSRGANLETASAMHQLKPEVLTQVDQLLPIAQELDMPLSQMAIAWCLRRADVSSVIIGASRPEQIEENIKGSGVILPDEVVSQIDGILNADQPKAWV